MDKTNRCTEFQFYWHDDSKCFGQPFCPSSRDLSRTSALVLYMQLVHYMQLVTTTAYIVPNPMHGSEILMMGRKAARNM